MRRFLPLLLAVLIISCKKKTDEKVIPDPPEIVNAFKLNGSQRDFVNSHATGYYSKILDKTILNIYGKSARDSIGLNFYLDGKNIGKYTEDDSAATLILTMYDNNFNSVSYNSDDADVFITSYGEINGEITGKFTARVSNSDRRDSLYLTDGIFKVKREVDR